MLCYLVTLLWKWLVTGGEFKASTNGCGREGPVSERRADTRHPRGAGPLSD